MDENSKKRIKELIAEMKNCAEWERIKEEKYGDDNCYYDLLDFIETLEDIIGKGSPCYVEDGYIVSEPWDV